MAFVFIIGVAQAFFIFLVLLNKKKKSLSDNILALWIFIIGLHLLLFYLYYIDYYQVLPHLLGIMVPLPLVHGPFLLIYVTLLIKEKQKFNKLLLLHFTPALIFYFLLLPIMILPAAEKLHYVFEVLPVEAPLYFDVFDLLIIISGPVYTVWSLILLKENYRKIKENYSYIEKINLIWLRNLIIGMAVIWVAVIITSFMDEDIGSTIVFVAVTFFVFLIGYYGTRQGVIFTDPVETSPDGSSSSKEKYKKSPLNANQSQSLLEKLLVFMEEEKPYLASKITLPQLASRFETNPNYLSQVINEKLNQNLYDFINKYRVEEFKKRLANEDALNYTLFGLAQDCGFSSKSSFHEVFKKHTGQTPSQYQANIFSTVSN
jgi:AraC-like DNA-binding protein